MEQWENLEIDISDLTSFVHRCNTNTSLISGQTGNVQAVILNCNSKEAVNTQEFINNIANENHRRDFDSNPWNWAHHFLNFHGNVMTIIYSLTVIDVQKKVIFLRTN